jgi:hypothetical protein
MSFSGLGAMPGGPSGGRQQRSQYDVASRWNPERIERKLLRCHALMMQRKEFEIRSGDFQPILESLPKHSFAYLDPPYSDRLPSGAVRLGAEPGNEAIP